MVLFTKGNLIKEQSMGMEFINGLVELFIKVNGRIINLTAKANINGLVVENI